MVAARSAWIEAHPYLAPIASFQDAIEAAAAQASPRAVAAPRWERWIPDAAAGVPLLRSAAAGPELAAAAAGLLAELAARLAGGALPDAMTAACASVRAALERAPGERARVIAWIADGASPRDGPAHAGLVRHLAWTAARRALAAALEGAGAWCDEERWGHPHCPACGAAPALAHLAPADGARRRWLACGCCGTRWPWRRVGCPFCANVASDRIRILPLEGDDELRLDVCGECGGYLKTFVGDGDATLFLADWPTLHADLAAAGRGLRRAGASLYDLPDEQAPELDAHYLTGCGKPLGGGSHATG